MVLSFEVNQCIGNMSSLLVPIIAKLPEPYPTSILGILCLGATYSGFGLGRLKETVGSEKSLLSLMKDHNISVTSLRGNFSSFIHDTRPALRKNRIAE